MAILITAPGGREAERAFVTDAIFGEFLGLEYLCTTHGRPYTSIRLVDDPSDLELRIPDILLSVPAAHWLTTRSMPTSPVETWKGVPVLYGDQSQPRFRLDVLGSVFFMLTRYEELVRSSERDEYDRFAATSSVAREEGFLGRAVVDEWIDLLWSSMQRLWPRLNRRARRYRLLLSHDVDDPGLYWRRPGEVARSIAADIARRREPEVAARKLSAYISTLVTRRPVVSDPYNTFDFVMATSEHNCVRSAFNFFGGRSNSRHDARYELAHPWIRSLLRSIHARGHEIGLHPSYESYIDGSRIREEFAALQTACREEGIEREAWGGRQHYLRWRNPDTWQHWDDAGLAYDSTLGFADQVGFRTGTCHEHPVWNLHTRQRMAVRERPLVAMDVTLLTYMRLSLEQTEGELLRLAAVCRRHHGDFTLLWHTHTLFSLAARQTYTRVVAALAP